MTGSRIERLTLLPARNTFVADVAALFGGKLAAGVLGLVAAPVIARLFYPDDFGVAALFVSLVVVFGPVSTLCYDQAIVLPEGDDKARDLMVLALLCSAALALLVALPMTLMMSSAPGFDVTRRLDWYLNLLPFAMVILATVNVAENLLTRKRRFSNIAGADVTQALTTPLTRIGLALAAGSTVWGLIAGYFAGLSMRLLALSRAFRHEFRIGVSTGHDRLYALAREYRDFPLANAPARFIRALSNQLPVIVLAFAYSPTVVGIYAMSYRLVSMPGEAVATSVRRVFLQRSAATRNAGGSVFLLLRNTTLAMAAIALLALALIWLLADIVVPPLLGERWADVANYIRVLGVWYVFVWAAVPTSAMFIVLRRQGAWFKIQFVLAVTRVLCLAMSYLLDAEPIQMIAAFVAAGVAVNLFAVVFMLLFARRTEREGVPL